MRLECNLYVHIAPPALTYEFNRDQLLTPLRKHYNGYQPICNLKAELNGAVLQNMSDINICSPVGTLAQSE